MKKMSASLFLNVTFCLLLLLLPYYLFQGKLFIGGDDTRLLYSYPFEYIKNLSFFSWYNGSSIGINAAHQFLLPFLFLWNGLHSLITNRVVLSYTAFSLPLLLGFLYFQKFVLELFTLDKKYEIEVLIGALFYILSPILIINQLFIFLTAVWLLGVIPAMGYFYIKYIRTSNFIYIFYSILFSIIFSLSMFGMPWLFGVLLPVAIGAVAFLFLLDKKEIGNILSRSLKYGAWLVCAHAFWIFGFLAPYISRDTNSFASTYATKGFVETFAPIVLSTAKSSIMYPLLNLFHRQITFDFSWLLKNDFLNLYDHTFWLNGVFVCVLFFGLFQFKKRLNASSRRIYIGLLVSFIVSLYLFTVNIGPLKDLFIQLGKIPGFIMFRNFYDKFAPGYVFLYAILFAVGLILVKQVYPKLISKLLYGIGIIILINFSAVKSTVSAPLWMTNNIYKNIVIPQEYTQFMRDIQKNVSSTNIILSIPFGSTVYTTIKDEKSDDVFVGLSPVKLFSGVNDISGTMSFLFTKEGNDFRSLILNRQYEQLNEALYNRGINYVLVTKNIPNQVLQSWVYEKNMLDAQDTEFLSAITDKKVLTSSQGNYELYTTKKLRNILSAKGLMYEKHNSVLYELSFKNMSETDVLSFSESYNSDWKLYPLRNVSEVLCEPVYITAVVTECKESFRFFSWDELSYLWKNSVFDASHHISDSLTNEWEIDPSTIKKRFGSEYYTENPDGTINMKLMLYYKPQLYFYYGSILSGLTFIMSCVVLFILWRNKKI